MYIPNQIPNVVQIYLEDKDLGHGIYFIWQHAAVRKDSPCFAKAKKLNSTSE